jgi:PKD domain
MFGRKAIFLGAAFASLLLSFPLMAVAAPPDTDCITFPETCVKAAEGSIGVSKQTTVRGRGASGTAESVEVGRPADYIDPTAAACQDASADVIASGGARQAIVDLCANFISLPAAPSRDQILRAFRELPLYRGAIRTEPARWTLVNLETFFWCGDRAGNGCDVVGQGERRVVLLGRTVRVRPRITAYSWSFGDGGTAEVTAGRAAHTYLHAGSRTVTLTLTWTADYAVGGGVFQPIEDTTTTTSAPLILPVREAQTVIVGEG